MSFIVRGLTQVAAIGASKFLGNLKDKDYRTPEQKEIERLAAEAERVRLEKQWEAGKKDRFQVNLFVIVCASLWMCVTVYCVYLHGWTGKNTTSLILSFVYIAMYYSQLINDK
jgi:hypothetical protein